jgi:hypothetical protein
VYESVRVYMCMYIYNAPKKCGTPRRCVHKPVVRRWEAKQGILDLSLRSMRSMRGQGFLYSSSSDSSDSFRTDRSTLLSKGHPYAIQRVRIYLQCNLACMTCMHSEQPSCAAGLLCSNLASKFLPGGMSYRICKRVE